MTKQELIKKLLHLRQLQDRLVLNEHTGHLAADSLLLKFIDDPEVRKAFKRIYKWYA